MKMNRQLTLASIILGTLILSQAASASIIGLLVSSNGNNVSVKYLNNAGVPSIEVNVPQAADCPIRFYRDSVTEFANPEDAQKLAKPDSKILFGLWDDTACLQQLPRNAKRSNRTFVLDLKREIFDQPGMAPYYAKFLSGKVEISFGLQVPDPTGYETQMVNTGSIRIGTTPAGTILFDKHYAASQKPTVTDLGLTSLKQIDPDVIVGAPLLVKKVILYKQPKFVGDSSAIQFPTAKAYLKWSYDGVTRYKFAMYEGRIIDRDTQADLARQGKTYCSITLVAPRANDTSTEISVSPKHSLGISANGGGCAFCGSDDDEKKYADLIQKNIWESMIGTYGLWHEYDSTDIDGLSCTVAEGQKFTYGVLSKHIRANGLPIVTAKTDYPPFQEGFSGAPQTRQLDPATLPTGLSETTKAMDLEVQLSALVGRDAQWKPEITRTVQQSAFTIDKAQAVKVETDYVIDDGAKKLVRMTRIYTILKNGQAISLAQAQADARAGKADFCILQLSQNFNVDTRPGNRNPDDGAAGNIVTLPEMTQYFYSGNRDKQNSESALLNNLPMSVVQFDSNELERKFKKEPYVPLYEAACLNSEKKDLTLSDVQKHLTFLQDFRTDLIAQQAK